MANKEIKNYINVVSQVLINSVKLLKCAEGGVIKNNDNVVFGLFDNSEVVIPIEGG